MDNNTLTEREAYAAMYTFLDRIWERNNDIQLGSLLGDMSTLEDGDSADPAARVEWLECVEQAKKGSVDTSLQIFPSNPGLE
jgi:hypothetical protein